MVTNGSWEQVTLTLIEQKRRQIEAIPAKAEERPTNYEGEIETLKEALRIYKEKMSNGRRKGVSVLTNEDVQGKSQTEILRLIASRNDGLLAAQEAIKMMKELQIFGNPENADSAVYSLLNRRKEFVKITAGLYRLEPDTITSR